MKSCGKPSSSLRVKRRNVESSFKFLWNSIQCSDISAEGRRTRSQSKRCAFEEQKEQRLSAFKCARRRRVECSNSFVCLLAVGACLMGAACHSVCSLAASSRPLMVMAQSEIKTEITTYEELVSGVMLLSMRWRRNLYICVGQGRELQWAYYDYSTPWIHERGLPFKKEWLDNSLLQTSVLFLKCNGKDSHNYQAWIPHWRLDGKGVELLICSRGGLPHAGLCCNITGERAVGTMRSDEGVVVLHGLHCVAKRAFIPLHTTHCIMHLQPSWCSVEETWQMMSWEELEYCVKGGTEVLYCFGLLNDYFGQVFYFLWRMVKAKQVSRILWEPQ